MKTLVVSLSRAIDLVLAPFVLLFCPLGYVIARLRKVLPRCRRILDRFGIAVLRYHYYEPLVRPQDIRKDLGRERPISGLDLNPAGQIDLAQRFRYRDELLAFPMEKHAVDRFGYHNGSFESGDAEYLYNMVRHFRPLHIVEIGAGNSTLIACAAVEKNKAVDPAYACDHVCIEPFEQPWLERIGVRVIRKPVELCEDEIFTTLVPNDILFIDSSHVIRPQGDVVHEYLYLLGRLVPGVLVHVHDIFTPRDYPASWVLEERRLWNEQYLLEAFLSFNRSFEVIGAVNWLWHNYADKLNEACPVLVREPDREPGSFWFRRV